MLKLLKSELNYNLKVYLLYLVMLPIFYIVVLLYESDFMQGMILSFFPFMLTNQIITLRNKEFREQQFNLIPVNREHLGIHRLLLIVIPITLCFIVLVVIGFILVDGFAELEKISIIYGIIIICLSVYFIIRDSFLSYLRERGFTKNKMLIYFMLTGLIFNVLGIVVFMLVKAGYDVPVGPLFEFFKNNNPFSGELVELRTIAFGLMIAVISIYSYNRNRSYME